MAARVPARLTRQEARRFGATLGPAFLALAVVVYWRKGITAAAPPATLGVILVLAAALVPQALAPVHRGWMALARTISKVTTPLVMGLMYFLVIAPVGLLRRSLGSSPLRRDPAATSFWLARDAGRHSDLNRQF